MDLLVKIYINCIEINLVLQDIAEKKKEINHPDVIIHLAGKVHDLRNVSNPEEYYKSNTDLTKEIYDQFVQIFRTRPKRPIQLVCYWYGISFIERIQ